MTDWTSELFITRLKNNNSCPCNVYSLVASARESYILSCQGLPASAYIQAELGLSAGAKQFLWLVLDGSTESAGPDFDVCNITEPDNDGQNCRRWKM